MKRFFLLVITALVYCNSFSQSFKVATYNLRFDNQSDTADLWVNREPFIAGLIRFNGFDIFGTQEGLYHQLQQLKDDLPGYDYIGVARDDGDKKGEHSAIFFRTDRFTLEDSGNLWLSSDTSRPNLGWDAACIRICTWGLFRDKLTDKEFVMFNVHYDHVGTVARMESSKLMLRAVEKIAGEKPAILTGDFNVTENSESYLLLKNSAMLEDSYDHAAIKFAPSGTFNGFDVNSKPLGRIDHIFVTGAFTVSRYGILTNIYNGHCPSDHFPVMVELSF